MLFNTSEHLMARQRGFAGVDLISVGIIAILIGLLLPAVQRARESANRNAAQSNASVMADYAMQFQSRYSRIPTGLTELISECRSQTQCPLPQNLQDGVADGYRYSFNQQNRVVEAWPGASGLTGSETLIFNAGIGSNDANRWINLGAKRIALKNGLASLASPGANDLRQQALFDVDRRLFESLGRLLTGNSALISRIRAGDLLAAESEILSVLNSNHDSSVNIEEILSALETLPSDGSGQAIAAALGFGSYEEGSSSGMAIADLESEIRDAWILRWGWTISNSGTLKLVSQTSQQGLLKAIVDEIEANELAGNHDQAEIGRQRLAEKIDSGVGSWITREHANILKAVAEASSAR